MAGVLTLGAGLCIISWLLTRWIMTLLGRSAVFDHPNERSSHTTPTPRGGGIAIMVVMAPMAALVLWLHDGANTAAWAMIGGMVVLAVVSWMDDLNHLPVLVRLGFHGAAVAVVLALLPEKFLLFQGLAPLWADRIVAGIAWLWFINLYNFMDGIDGLAATETVTIGIGIFAILLVIGADGGGEAVTMALIALVMAAAAGGFLFLNWHPARIFMGDVGSIPLGFVAGWLLLMLAMWGYWLAALILPAYYLADASITIIRRALGGAEIWRAHKEHFYQRAVARGLSHGRVTFFILRGNVMLLALALAAAVVVNRTGDLLCLAGTAGVVAIMLVWLARAQPDG